MENNLDINLIIQSFQEKVSQLMVEIVVKEATIKQLTDEIRNLKKPSWQSQIQEQKNVSEQVTGDGQDYSNPRDQKKRSNLVEG